jgi:hypothetical protein
LLIRKWALAKNRLKYITNVNRGSRGKKLERLPRFSLRAA